MITRILLADDHKIMRYGLSEAISNESDMEVAGVAENGIQVVEMAKNIQPDVVLMDITMPLLNGIEATRQIVAANPGIKVIGLSMHSSAKLITEIFDAGAKGYVLKDCEYKELLNAIRVVMKGDIYITAAVRESVEKTIRNGLGRSQSDTVYTLSERERQVTQLFAEGKTTRQIGSILFISPKIYMIPI